MARTSPSPPSGGALAAATAIAAAGSLCLLYFAASSRRAKKRETAELEQDDENVDIFSVPSELRAGAGGDDDVLVPYHSELRRAITLAIEAGDNMTSHLDMRGTCQSSSSSNRELGVDVKTNNADFCTEIDLENETLIANSLLRTFPTHRVIGEESTGTGEVEGLHSEPGTSTKTWIIDPIDGTTNFFYGLPLTCVSVGMCDGTVPVLGVVYCPSTRELYVGIKGRGAYRNGQRIESMPTGERSEGRKLSDSLVVFELGSVREERSIIKMTNVVRNILIKGCRSVRSFGCGVMDLCYVASGRIDLVYTGVTEEGWKPWDYCAGMVIAEEAGCTIRSIYGRPGMEGGRSDEFDPDTGEVVAGSSFDIYSKSMICGVDKSVVEECRRVILESGSSS